MVEYEYRPRLSTSASTDKGEIPRIKASSNNKMLTREARQFDG
jgi:hypothetical protein